MNRPFYYMHHVQVAVVYEVSRKVKELYKDFEIVEIKRFIRKIKLQGFDHERLRDTLRNIEGRFLLSYDDSPKVRELYKDFEMIEVERQNGINNRQGADRQNKVYKELLIANYPIKELHHAR